MPVRGVSTLLLSSPIQWATNCAFHSQKAKKVVPDSLGLVIFLLVKCILSFSCSWMGEVSYKFETSVQTTTKISKVSRKTLIVADGNLRYLKGGRSSHEPF